MVTYSVIYKGSIPNSDARHKQRIETLALQRMQDGSVRASYGHETERMERQYG